MDNDKKKWDVCGRNESRSSLEVAKFIFEALERIK